MAPHRTDSTIPTLWVEKDNINKILPLTTPSCHLPIYKGIHTKRIPSATGAATKIAEKTSRRRAQRHLKWCYNNKNAKQNEHLLQKIHRTQRYCLTNFGFCANPNLSLQSNFNKTIKETTTHPHLQPLNLTYHNLCSPHIQLPTGIRQLLGLNLKFCLATNKLPDNTSQTALKLAHSIRPKHFLMESNYQGEAEYIKQIYKKNPKWNPPPAPPLIEEKITTFEKLLKTEPKKLNHKYSTRSLFNLTSTQLITL